MDQQEIKKRIFELEILLDDISEMKADLFSSTYSKKEKKELDDLELKTKTELNKLTKKLKTLE